MPLPTAQTFGRDQPVSSSSVHHQQRGLLCAQISSKYCMREIIDEIAVMLILFLMGMITWLMMLGLILLLLRHM